MIERLWAWWGRVLASPRFQHWAAAFPLTRPVARRRSRHLFDLVAGFVYTQTLLAALEIGLFDLLDRGPLPFDVLAKRIGMDEERLVRLLNAGVSIRLFRRHGDGRYGLGHLGAPLVGNQGLRAMVEHNRILYRDLEDPVGLLTGKGLPDTELRRYWAYTGAADRAHLSSEAVEDYSRLMTASQPLVQQEILDAYPFDRHQALLDVGGGEGAFVEGLARRFPRLQLSLLDLPAVAERARARLDSVGIGSRVIVHGGDFLVGELPAGADLVTLVRVVHDLDDVDAARVLRNIHRILPPGGRLLIAEPMAGQRGAEPVGGAYFAWYLLAMGKGRARTPGELRRMLRRAGFGKVSRARARSPVLTSVLFATR